MAASTGYWLRTASRNGNSSTARSWATTTPDAHWAAYYLASGGRFPHRAQVVTLVGELQTELNHTVAAWARRAHDTVSEWPEDLEQAPLPLDVLREIAVAVDDDVDLSTPPAGYDETRR